MVIFLESEGHINKAMIFAALSLHDWANSKGWKFVGSLDNFTLAETLNIKEALGVSAKTTVIICDSPISKLENLGGDGKPTDPEALEIRKALKSKKKNLVIHIPETNPVNSTGRMELAKRFKIPVTEIPGLGEDEMVDPRKISQRLLEFLNELKV